MVERTIAGQLNAEFYKGKIAIIYGARQVGKTTLVRELQKAYPDSVYLNCDEPDIAASLTGKTSTELLKIFGNSKMVFIDEAQRVENIGLSLKLIADNRPDIQVVATGSSSFDLANKITEPLTGRNDKYHLHPLSTTEITDAQGKIETARLTDQRVIYGSYPEPFFLSKENREKRLKELAGDYTFKDILSLGLIRKNEKIIMLLKNLALQIGSEVSYSEIGQALGLNYDTVETYISLLEQTFIIFRLQPYNRNQRNAIRKSRKVYFWDTGIRNALINNFNPLNLRNDSGALFENFFIAELLKEKSNRSENITPYFWRDYQKKEVDLLIESNGRITAYECKLSGDGGIKKAGGLEAAIVTKENYLEFLTL
ncbi:MAG: hypothetical protein A3G59_00615 [Candidatus Taylorbacteria bacterium RIFCSPLOWO2_12_FULL_47_20]|uniref:AAA+ ATPase domain-containing protein n=2 Tax=Candidatus Tayloriibacteriota TaxID=1817919 RepID=A0A1G2P767_9BACT|nr:MAG: hypothetical protein A3H68_01280 [Candidatus Taylorbacteria bacterium RIFCSPLOWO2_02_FULL_46_40]OHA44168.1 MAG: hypothetical protein A3G59_00615 [Candidatus Taylorbacteria bacterium RIFCSPLOWO2_12_FULL_47_20]